MSIHVDKMNSDVTVIDGDSPLSERQVEKLVQIVLERLESTRREEQKNREATTLTRSNAPPARVGE